MDYDTWHQNSPLEFKKKLTEDFIKETIAWALSHIDERKKELAGADYAALDSKCSRLWKWISYAEFQQHTLDELKGNKLDRFLQKP